VKLYRDERLYYHAPFWGNGGVTPQIQLGVGASWVTMSVASGYTPPSDWEPPTGFLAADATWYRTLVAGPDAAGNGAVVLSASATRVRTKVVAGDEIDIQPDGPNEWIFLVS